MLRSLISPFLRYQIRQERDLALRLLKDEGFTPIMTNVLGIEKHAIQAPQGQDAFDPLQAADAVRFLARYGFEHGAPEKETFRQAAAAFAKAPGEVQKLSFVALRQIDQNYLENKQTINSNLIKRLGVTAPIAAIFSGIAATSPFAVEGLLAFLGIVGTGYAGRMVYEQNLAERKDAHETARSPYKAVIAPHLPPAP